MHETLEQKHNVEVRSVRKPELSARKEIGALSGARLHALPEGGERETLGDDWKDAERGAESCRESRKSREADIKEKERGIE